MSINEYVKKEIYSWDMLLHDMEILATKVTKEFKPDVIVCISTGGWIPGRIMKNHIPAIYYSIGCLAYKEDGNFSGNIRLVQKFGDDVHLEGKNILILDEVCETGNTISRVEEYLRNFKPLDTKTAVIHQKSHSDTKANYYVHWVEDKWIIYPWSLV